VGRDREIDPHAVIVGAPIALVDCNNFYASCERVFQPRLRGLPVVVLSNNDDCVIDRSNKAKALGVEMGAPWHLCRESFRKTGVVVQKGIGSVRQLTRVVPIRDERHWSSETLRTFNVPDVVTRRRGMHMLLQLREEGDEE
jgi:hypothetical protein